ncbi:hypothetical protein [Halomicrococcus sp. SG-WS-1]|uniref:hypothetical protein n=1 Tax=Halomicrococcus sp. SG-WS-1 TaxID=3439057 RepID=UPI003F7A6010
MGNTVRTFSSLGMRESVDESKSEQERLGDALEEISGEERLGDYLAKRSEDDGIDPVEAVRKLREDV